MKLDFVSKALNSNFINTARVDSLILCVVTTRWDAVNKRIKCHVAKPAGFGTTTGTALLTKPRLNRKVNTEVKPTSR